jgi:hypothetical protein
MQEPNLPKDSKPSSLATIMYPKVWPGLDWAWIVRLLAFKFQNWKFVTWAEVNKGIHNGLKKQGSHKAKFGIGKNTTYSRYRYNIVLIYFYYIFILTHF